VFTSDIEIINCLKNFRKLYTKMYTSRKWRWCDAAILSGAAASRRSVMTGGGGVSKTSAAAAAHTSSKKAMYPFAFLL